ncbi:MAG: hypothetical protein KatS3mg092_0592 [Patescibacteria group bacterium]|nr:MAG: hypothetical protein KatS3mg092_0592 [Patescibacteria group bacterium]
MKKINKNLEYYNQEKIFNSPYHVKKEIDFLSSLIKFKKNLKVVDFGCGAGRLTIPLLKNNIKVIAIDIDDNALINLKENAKKINKLNYLKIAKKISSSDLDYIVGTDILHHIKINHYGKVFFNNLKKRGKIVFSEPNPLNISWLFFISLFLNWSEEKGIFACNYFNLINVFKNAGFQKIKIIGYGLLPPQIFGKIELLHKINNFLANLPILKIFAYRLIIYGEK